MDLPATVRQLPKDLELYCFADCWHRRADDAGVMGLESRLHLGSLERNGPDTSKPPLPSASPNQLTNISCGMWAKTAAAVVFTFPGGSGPIQLFRG